MHENTRVLTVVSCLKLAFQAVNMYVHFQQMYGFLKKKKKNVHKLLTKCSYFIFN